MIERRRCIMGKPYIPAEYQQVEYLKSTGTLYLRINVNIDNNDEFLFVFSKDNSTNWSGTFGTFNSFGGRDGFFSSYDGTRGYIAIGPEVGASYELNKKQHFYYKYPISRVELVEKENTDFYVPNFSFFGLFTYFELNESGVIIVNKPNKCTIWEVKITNKVHLIPCYRKSDNKPGMYDIVNNVFYTNAGTGEFIVGPDVN